MKYTFSFFPLLFTKAETTLHGQVRRDVPHVQPYSDSPSIAPCTAQYTVASIIDRRIRPFVLQPLFSTLKHSA